MKKTKRKTDEGRQKKKTQRRTGGEEEKRKVCDLSRSPPWASWSS